MVTRRRFLEYGAVAGGLSALGVQASSPAGALSPAAYVVNDFDSSAYPGENELGEWSEHVAFEAASVDDGVLRLEYDDGGFFATNAIDEDLSGFDRLEFRMRGDDGGEEADVLLRVGDVRAPLADLTDGSVDTEFQTIVVDFDDVGVDPASIDDVRLNFWRGGSGAVEIDGIWLVDEPDGGGGGGTEIGPDTTFDEFYTESHREDYEYSQWDQPIRAWTEYLPGDLGGGHGDHGQVNWPDGSKIDEFDVDTDAVEARHNSGEPLTFAQMGTQALGWVQQFEAHGFPRHASAKLLPRLSILPDETETPTYHNTPEQVLAESGDRVPATNDPDTLIQDPWPPCARSYDPEGVALRDRAHDQPQHEDRDWTTYEQLPDDRYYDEANPIHDVADGVHPATGEDLGGDGFTANAPMAVEAKLHQENDNYWYQVLEFENTSPVPYHVNAAVVMWIGPSGANGGLRNGHYNNEQRPQPGWGHPQRDVIEVVHDEDRHLSAYAVRIAFHDEPYNMRTAYPNQLWSLEVGMADAADHFETEDARQELTQTMVDTCHVEIETEMDRNDGLMDALDLRNRMTN